MTTSTPDASAVRAWLVSMTLQGEDRIWRGAEAALRFFDASFRPEADRWCWSADGPEDTYPSPRDWLSEMAPWLDAPFVQRFGWAVSAPDSFAVFYLDEHESPACDEFATAEEAKARRAALAASVDTHPEGGDANAAPFMSGAVGSEADETPNLPHERSNHA